MYLRKAFRTTQYDLNRNYVYTLTDPLISCADLYISNMNHVG